MILRNTSAFSHNTGYLHHIFPTTILIIESATAGLITGLAAVGVITGGKKVFALLKR